MASSSSVDHDAKLLSRTADTWARRDRAIELFVEWLAREGNTLPVHPNELRAFNLFLIQAELGSSVTPTRNYIVKWLKAPPFSVKAVLREDTSSWSPARLAAEVAMQRLLGSDSGTICSALDDVAADCLSMTDKGNPEKVDPPTEGALKRAWPGMNTRQRSIVAWAGAMGVRNATFVETQPCDVVRSKNATGVRIRTDKLRNQVGRIQFYGCGCGICEDSAVGIGPSDLCLLHGGARALTFPVRDSEMIELNKLLKTSGHGWRRALALGTRARIEAGWNPSESSVNAHFGWEDRDRVKSYSLDLRTWEAFPPLRFDKILLCADRPEAKNLWSWLDPATKTGSTTTHIRLGGTLFREVKKDTFERGSRTVHGSRVVTAPPPKAKWWTDDEVPSPIASLRNDNSHPESGGKNTGGGAASSSAAAPKRGRSPSIGLPTVPPVVDAAAPASSPSGGTAPAPKRTRTAPAPTEDRHLQTGFIGPTQPALHVPRITVRPTQAVRQRSPLRVWLQNSIGFRKPAWKLSVKQRTDKSYDFEISAKCALCAKIDESRAAKDKVRRCGVHVSATCDIGDTEVALKLHNGRHDSGEIASWPTGFWETTEQVIGKEWEKSKN